MAFQANTGSLFVAGDAGSYDTQQGMLHNTSPGIGAVGSSGYEVAFQANTGSLFVFGSAGSYDTGQGMMAGTSPSSSGGSGGASGESSPSSPSNVTAAAGDSSAIVRWVVPTNNGNSPIVKYIVSSSPGTATCTAPGSTSTSCAVSGLENGTSYRFSVVAVNAYGISNASTSPTSTMPLGTFPATIHSPSTATFIATNPSTLTVTSTGTPTPTVTESGALPSGVSFTANPNGTATLSGTPTLASAGTYPITFTAHNGIGSDATQHFTLTVLPIEITTTSLPSGKAGAKYSATLKAVGGTSPYAWSLASGSKPLPPGLKLSSAGVISGTPTKKGTYSFTVKVVDTKTKTKPVVQHVATATFTITVS